MTRYFCQELLFWWRNTFASNCVTLSDEIFSSGIVTIGNEKVLLVIVLPLVMKYFAGKSLTFCYEIISLGIVTIGYEKLSSVIDVLLVMQYCR